MRRAIFCNWRFPKQLSLSLSYESYEPLVVENEDVQDKQGRSEGGIMPLAPNHWAAPKSHDSQQCHKYFLKCGKFTSERPQVQTRGGQTCFLPRAPSNLVTPLKMKQRDGNCERSTRFLMIKSLSRLQQERGTTNRLV